MARSGGSHDLLSRNAALGRDLALEREPRMDARTVRIDVHQRTIAELAQGRVLVLQHGVVLAERDIHRGEQRLGRFRLVLPVAVRRRPEEPAGVLGLRRDAVEDAQAEAAVALALLVGPLAHIERARELQDAGRRDVFELLPAVDTAVEADRFGIDAGRNAIEHPARELHAVRRRHRLHLRARIGVGIARQGRLVHVGGVGLVEQVVRDHQVIAGQALGLALVGPGLVEGIGDDLGRIGLLGLAHPDPREIVAIGDREAAHLRLGRNELLVRDLDAAPGAVEDHAVIFAADVVANDLAQRQRHPAVAAAVLQRDRRAALGAIEHHRLVEERARDRLGGDFVRPAGDVPSIAEIHRALPRSQRMLRL